MRFQQGVVDKARAGFFRFRQSEGCGRNDIDAKRFKQFGNLPDLARVMAGDDQTILFEAPCHMPASSTSDSETQRGVLRNGQLGDPFFGQTHHRHEGRFRERISLGGTLNFDNAALAGEDEVGVGFGV